MPHGDGLVMSDADPVNTAAPGAQYANNRRPGPTVRQVAGQWVEVTPAQAARLDASASIAQGALNRVRVLDPSWRPGPEIYGGVEGDIAHSESVARQADVRYRELQRAGAAPGEFAGESISARGPQRNFTGSERSEINRIGRDTGCHGCGTREPGTESENVVPDHQPPSALNRNLDAQRLYPHCVGCSTSQGGHLRHLLREIFK